MPVTRLGFAVWTLALAGACAAEAQTAPLKLDLSAAQASVPLDLSSVRRATSFTDAEAEALRTGVARTAVDRHFAEGLTGSLGFLCDPRAAMQYDSATARPGADPQGKFLGAKLSFAFR